MSENGLKFWFLTTLFYHLLLTCFNPENSKVRLGHLKEKKKECWIEFMQCWNQTLIFHLSTYVIIIKRQTFRKITIAQSKLNKNPFENSAGSGWWKVIWFPHLIFFLFWIIPTATIWFMKEREVWNYYF